MQSRSASSVNHARRLSVEYKDHIGLLKKFAYRGWCRLTAAGVNIEQDDVFQEMCVIFTKAQRKFDPAAGVAFSSYFGRAIWYEFNKVAERLINDAKYVMRIETDEAQEVYDNTGYVETVGPFEQFEMDRRKQECARQLTPQAKFFLAEFLRPSAPVVQHIDALERRASYARESGQVRLRTPRLTIKMIGKVYEGATVTMAGKRFKVTSKLAATVEKELFRVYEIRG